jgi:hypothetical protein
MERNSNQITPAERLKQIHEKSSKFAYHLIWAYHPGAYKVAEEIDLKDNPQCSCSLCHTKIAGKKESESKRNVLQAFKGNNTNTYLCYYCIDAIKDFMLEMEGKGDQTVKRIIATSKRSN